MACPCGSTYNCLRLMAPPLQVRQYYSFRFFSDLALALPVDVAVDGEDNIVVMGTFKGNMQLGSVALTGNPVYGSVFLARYHHNGTLLWATEVRHPL